MILIGCYPFYYRCEFPKYIYIKLFRLRSPTKIFNELILFLNMEQCHSFFKPRKVVNFLIELRLT